MKHGITGGGRKGARGMGHLTLILSLAFLLAGSLSAATGKSLNGHTSALTVNAGYDRVKSTVLVRKVLLPTRAALDYAAYTANILLYDSTSEPVKAPAAVKKLSDLSFGGVLVAATVADRIGKTPLSPAEKAAPVSWAALREFLLKWNFEKSQKLVEAMTAVGDERFENEELGKACQDPADLLFRFKDGKISEAWVKVEFKPWAKMFKFVDDEDKDRFPEIYGQINPEYLNPEMFTEIADNYLKKTLSKEEIITWANELASFWYPTFNTDIYHYEGTVWPDKFVEPEIVKGLKGLKFDRPLVAIKGKPFNFPLYEIILVEGMQKDVAAPESTSGPAATGKKAPDPSAVAAVTANREGLAKELASYGKDYASWAASFKAFHDGLRKILASEPADVVKGFEGKDDFLFFRGSYNYITGGDLAAQAGGTNPVPVITAFDRLMKASGADFIFIPVPVKPEIYPELTGVTPGGSGPYVNPWSRKFQKDLADSGVEVLDLYPAFLSEKAKDVKGGEPAYQRQDTHWGARGLLAASKLLAERIKKYSWYKELKTRAYTFRDTTIVKSGDIVSRLKSDLQPKYKPERLSARMTVNPDGSLYNSEAEKKSPILFLGDSFLGMFELTDCRHAGLSANVARELGVPLWTLVSYGGGPTITGKTKRLGKKGIEGRRLVVWVMVARDLYNYHEPWQKLEKFE